MSSLASWSWSAVLSGSAEGLADSAGSSAVSGSSSAHAAAPPPRAARPDAIRPNIIASAARPAAAEAHPTTRIEEIPGRGLWFEISASAETGKELLEEVHGRGIWLRCIDR